MIHGMFENWNTMGKPLFLAPKEFKDRIISHDITEVNLNLMKWTTAGSDVDVFEVMIVLCMYSRLGLDKRIELIFQLFCFSDEKVLTRPELRFMLGKICCSMSMTYQIKKSYLLELTEDLIDELLP